MEKTLCIIKPDALCENRAGLIINQILRNGFKISAVKMVRMSRERAGKFYAEHRGKPFYRPLVEFMSSNPVVVMVLSKKGAVKTLRRLVGATNPHQAAPGTIRKKYARDGRHNAVHASDSAASAKSEIAFFFRRREIYDWKYIDYPVIK